MCKNIHLYPADAYTGRDLSLFATINKQRVIVVDKGHLINVLKTPQDSIDTCCIWFVSVPTQMAFACWNIDTHYC